MDAVLDIGEDLSGALIGSFTEADMVEFQALNEQLDKVTEIESSMSNGVGHTHVLAMESLCPGSMLDHMPPGGYTLKISQQNLATALEAADDTKKNIFRRMLDWLVAKIKQFMDWLTGKGKDDAADFKEASDAAKKSVHETEVKEKEYKTAFRKAADAFTPEKTDKLRTHFEESDARVQENIERAREKLNMGKIRRPPKSTFQDGPSIGATMARQAADKMWIHAANRNPPVALSAFYSDFTPFANASKKTPVHAIADEVFARFADVAAELDRLVDAVESHLADPSQTAQVLETLEPSRVWVDSIAKQLNVDDATPAMLLSAYNEMIQDLFTNQRSELNSIDVVTTFKPTLTKLTERYDDQFLSRPETLINLQLRQLAGAVVKLASLNDGSTPSTSALLSVVQRHLVSGHVIRDMLSKYSLGIWRCQREIEHLSKFYKKELEKVQSTTLSDKDDSIVSEQ